MKGLLGSENINFGLRWEPDYLRIFFPFSHQMQSKYFAWMLYNCKLQVESENKYERVGGTSMGGGAFLGLGSLLTNAKVNGP